MRLFTRRTARTPLKSFSHELQNAVSQASALYVELHASHYVTCFRALQISILKTLHGVARRYMTMSISVELSSINKLHIRHRVRSVKTTQTGNTVLYVPTLFGNCGDLERTCGLTILNGVVFSTIPSCENYSLISRWRTIHIWSVSVGSWPPCTTY